MGATANNLMNGLTLVRGTLPSSPAIDTVFVDVVDGFTKKYNGASWDILGSGGVITGVNQDSVDTTVFDVNSVGDFTQTGLSLSTTNPIKGAKSALLTHQAAINQSFKKVIAVDRKFRNKNLTLSLANRSSAYASNLTLLITDETNAATLLSAQINTDKQAFLANTATSTTISAIPSTVINYLVAGQTITGVGIPVNTVIISVNATAFTCLISNATTATATGVAINTSGSISTRSFPFDVPATCASLSYTITALPEANLPESYIDDIQIALSVGLILPATVQIPRKVGTKSYTPIITGFGTPTAVEFEFDEDGEFYNIRGKFVSGTPTAVEARVSLPNSATSASGSLLPSIANVGSCAYSLTFSALVLSALIEPNVSYLTFGYSTSTSAAMIKRLGSDFSSNGNIISFFARVPIAGAQATINIAQSFSQAALVQTSDSYLRLNTSNGYGSTNTVIRRFTNIADNIGSDILYIDSPTLGASFTALTSGTFTVNYSESYNAGGNFGLSKNSSQLTTVYQSINVGDRLDGAYTNSPTIAATTTWTGYLNAGDVIRPHTDASGTSADTSRVTFSMSKQGSLKQVNPQLNNKITIPTHQLRFEGASAKGSTDTAIVKFDTQTLVQGDAWSVVNTAANGTVITMLKAGKLQVDSNLYMPSNQNFGITVNATSTTAFTVDNTTLTELAVNATGASILSTTKSVDVKIGDKIRIIATLAPTARATNSFSLSLVELSFPLAISNIWQQNGAGFNPDNLLLQQFDTAVLGDFTQTGLNFVIANALNGAKSAQLIHQAAINQSFKQIFQVSPKFRGKNLTLKHDIVSTTTAGNLTLTVTDETNSVVLVNASSVPTNSQSVTATVTNTSNILTAVSNAVINTLSLGMRVTGVNIPSNSYITDLSAVNGTITISQAAIGAGTVVRISGVVSIQKVSFDVPASCGQLSYLFTALPETLAETYIDGMSVDITSQVLSSTAITIPKNNDFSVRTQATITIGATTTAPTKGTVTTDQIIYSRSENRLIAEYQYVQSNASAVGSGDYLFTLPAGLSFDPSIVPYTGGLFSSSGASSLAYVGSGSITANATNSGIVKLIAYSTTQFRVVTQQGASAGSGLWYALSSGLVDFSFASGISFGFHVDAAIAGWVSNDTQSVTIPLTTAQLVQTPDSFLRVDNNGAASTFGSTATAVRIFTTVRESIGSSVQFLSDAVNGSRFVILEAGTYGISATDGYTTASYFGITKNAVSLITSPSGMPPDQILATNFVTTATANTNCAWEGYLSVGDIIRVQADNSKVGEISQPSTVSIVKQGSLKQLNASTDSKITIPTHQLRFEGSSTRGSTDTAILKFDTQTITQGDAWSVVNTAANGTVVTMLKAGKLTVGASLSSPDASYTITLNQQSLTLPPTASEGLSTGENAASRVKTLIATVDVKIGDKIRVYGSSAANAAITNNLLLSLTETSIPANFSNVLPQWSQSDSCIQLRTANGYGSTNTKIRRFSNTVQNLGADIAYTDDAVLGGYFTALSEGTFLISYSDVFIGATNMGVTRNTSQPSIALASLANPVEVLTWMTTVNTTGYGGSVSIPVYLLKGDVIRAHTDGTASGAGLEAKFTISKVGKPNLTAVDVTPFVNMKTTDTEAIEALTQTTTFGSTNTGVPVLNITRNTNLGVIQVVSDAVNGTKFVALKNCNLNISATGTFGGSGNIYLTRNSTSFLVNAPSNIISTSANITSNGAMLTISASVELQSGDIIRIQRDSNLTTVYDVTLVATADNNATASPTQQVSSDTIPFVFKATVIDPNVDPIGTFNTYTYAANTNTATIGATAPTQTTSSININGVQVFSRAYNAASTTASPARVDVFIGKGLKNKQVDAYTSAAKVGAASYDFRAFTASLSNQNGADVQYGELTGILTINAGMDLSGASTARSACVDAVGNNVSAGYFVFNASKSPSLVTIPNLTQRIAILKYDTTATRLLLTATNQTIPLNTIIDPTGIVQSFSAGAFSLLAGTYTIRVDAFIFNGASSGFNVFSRIYNITKAIDAVSCMVAESGAFAGNTTPIAGEDIVTVTNVTESFDFRSRASIGTSVYLGDTFSTPDAVKTIIKITKIK